MLTDLNDAPLNEADTRSTRIDPAICVRDSTATPFLPIPNNLDTIHV